MTQHIGVVACSAEGAALCYTTICIEGPALLGEYAHPEITMHSHSFSEYIPHIEAGNWEQIAELMLSSEAIVAKAGADFALCPDNTIHQAFDLVAARATLPWLHIAEEVVAEAKRNNYGRLGVLGTRYLMEGPVYREKLAAENMGCVIPPAPARERINRVIFEELVYGRFTVEARAYFAEVIGQLKSEGCDAVVLGCTEIPLLVSQEDSPLPVLDSTRLLARAGLRRAVGATAQ